jgi:hypothetical protein
MYRKNKYDMPSPPMMPMQGYPYRMPLPPNQPMSTPSNVIIQSPENDSKPAAPPVITNTAYLQGFLKSQIGKFMKVNFLLGTGTFIDKEGILQEVGIDHIVLREVATDTDVVADLYSIKFVEIPER